jgi:hypothetical protein
LIPLKLEELINKALSEVHSGLDHHLFWETRQSIYQTLGPVEYGITLNKARGLLAIMAARRVLPIFKASLPEEAMPEDLLTTAQEVVQGNLDINSPKMNSYLNDAYYAIKTFWGYKAVPWNAFLVGFAAFKALQEVGGWQPFQNRHIYTETSALKGTRDEDFAHTDDSDTALTAAVAFASGDHKMSCEPEKLLRFWNWWLTEAIPNVWEAAV